MPRIKIKDLPRDMKVSREEMKKISGGILSISSSYKNIMASYPTRYPTGTLTYYPYSSSPPVYYSEDCKCMGMAQDPKTELLPG
jgi:hypothetical protein